MLSLYRLGEVIGEPYGNNQVRVGIHVPTSTRVAVKIITIRDEQVWLPSAFLT